MMSGYVESSSAAFSIVILGGFVIAMILLASYVFTREVNNHSNRTKFDPKNNNISLMRSFSSISFIIVEWISITHSMC